MTRTPDTSIDYKWDKLFFEGDFFTASEFLRLYEEKKFDELGYGIKQFLESAIRVSKNELLHELTNLMECILLWQISEKYRTTENAVQILDHRHNIGDALEFDGCLSEETIKIFWDEAFNGAKEYISEKGLNAMNFSNLSWDEVFNHKYTLLNVE